MTAAKRYALYALETLLGPPENLTRERDGNAAGVQAAWNCGCVAQGRTTAALEIRICPSHGTLFDGG
jgi:hypothetical protein